jgi:lysozyme family protein
MSNADKAVDFILSKEGGYVNDPKDPGGETNFGISKREFPKLDIKALTKEQAREIYKLVYWTANQLESLPWPYSAAVLDAFVQHRPSVVKKMLDAAQGDLRALLEQRRIFYLKLIADKPELKRFKNGWFNRINDLSKFCEMNEDR